MLGRKWFTNILVYYQVWVINFEIKFKSSQLRLKFFSLNVFELLLKSASHAKKITAIKSVLRPQYLFCSGTPSIWKFWSCSDFSFHWLFLNSEGDALLQCTAYDYFEAEWDHLRSHLRDVLWHDIFQLSTSTATTEYSEWLQVEIDVCISNQKKSGHGSFIFMFLSFLCCCYSS